jgi:hypothetical protein
VPESFRLIKRSRTSEEKSEENHGQPDPESTIKDYPSKALTFRREQMRDKKRDSDSHAVVFGRSCDAGQKAGNGIIPRARI